MLPTALLLVTLAQSPGPQLQEVELQATDGGYATANDQTLLVPPVLLQDSPAAYPPGSATQGTVALELLISSEGTVQEARVTGPLEPTLDASAIQAALGLRFHPARAAGAAVPVRLRFEYRFVAPPRPDTFVLRGQVLTRGTRRPLPAAHLRSEGHASQSTEEGTFQLALPAGTRTVRVEAHGHLPLELTETGAAGETLEVLYRLEPATVDPYQTVVRSERRTEVARVALVEQELREVPGTLGDPFRVVMLLPGVAGVASGISYPVVRGTQPASTGYFIDGVRVPSLFHLVLGPAVVHPELVEGMDFFSGLPPVEYGRLLMGAVDGKLRQPSDRLRVSASADLINAGALVEVPLAATGTHVTVAGRFSYTPWLLALAANATQVNPGTTNLAEFSDYQGRVEQRVGQGRLRLLALGASDLVGMESEQEGAFDGALTTRFHRLDLRLRHPAGPGELELGATVGRDESGAEAQVGEIPTAQFQLRETNLGARASWRASLGETWFLTAGATVEHRRSDSELTPPVVGGTDFEANAFTTANQAVGTSFGAHAQLAWRPTEAWQLVGGVRLDHHVLVPRIRHTSVDPRLAVHHQLSDTLSWRASVGMAHQPPTVLLNLPVMDLAALRYGLQESVQGDVTVEWKPTRGLELSVSAYHAELTRTVELDLTRLLADQRRRVPGGDPSEHGRAQGVELMVRHPLGENWFGWLSYSLSRSTRVQRFLEVDEVAGTAVEREAVVPFAFDQTHVLNAAVSYQLPGHWTLGAGVHFNTGRPEGGQLSSFTHRAAVDAGGGGLYWERASRADVQRLPPFARIDARVAKRWVLDSAVVEASLDLLNLSLSQEVLGYFYGYRSPVQPDGSPGPSVLEKQPFSLAIALPLLGVKVTY